MEESTPSIPEQTNLKQSEKESIMNLINAVSFACTKGAYNLEESADLSKSKQILIELLNKK